MASEAEQNDTPKITTLEKGPQSQPFDKSPLTNGTASARSSGEIPRKASGGYSEAALAILSRAGLAKSETFLRPFADTPPTAPTSPRLGP